MEFEENPKQSPAIRSFVESLHQVHIDNSKLQYFACTLKGKQYSTAPLTPFIFEFFIFNSLYQIDWVASMDSAQITSQGANSEKRSESQNQRSFIKFLQTHASDHPQDLYRAFAPILSLGAMRGDWTKVASDERIKESDGDDFFMRIEQIQTELITCTSPSKMRTSNSVFKLIENCAHFIYLVRNNVFHGSKSLGDTWDEKQIRRLEVYGLFLKCLTSLFFLVFNIQEVASDIVPCPILSTTLGITGDREILNQSDIHRAIALGLMKLGDSQLISRFTRAMPPGSTNRSPTLRSALFYPGSGNDLLTPILLGLPYCTHFYFFDVHETRNSKLLKEFKSLLNQFGGSGDRNDRPHSNDGSTIEFSFDGISRQVHLVRSDNLAVFEMDLDLSFYFHRGDSSGEGGSGQFWDSKLLPELLKKVGSGMSCIFLTDGEPGGFQQPPLFKPLDLGIQFRERDRPYFAGRYSKSD